MIETIFVVFMLVTCIVLLLVVSILIAMAVDITGDIRKDENKYLLERIKVLEARLKRNGLSI